MYRREVERGRRWEQRDDTKGEVRAQAVVKVMLMGCFPIHKDLVVNQKLRADSDD